MDIAFEKITFRTNVIKVYRIYGVSVQYSINYKRKVAKVGLGKINVTKRSRRPDETGL
jgi:hypothetical protein